MECGYVGILTVDLHLPEAGSLKAKRKQLLRVRNGLVRRFSCAVAEVDHHDLWQRAGLTLAVVGRSAAETGERLADAERWLHGDEWFQVVGSSREVVAVDPEPAARWGS
jgi:uncharacterized protein